MAEVHGQAAANPAAVEARLVATRGPLAGESVVLDQAIVTIGRSPGSVLAIPDAAVSRRHCEIHRDGPRYRLIDLGSSHGTSVNGMRVESHVLEHRDRLAIGESEMVFLFGTDLAGPVAVDLTDAELTVTSPSRLRVTDAIHLHPERLLLAPESLPLDALVAVSKLLRDVRQPDPMIEALLELVLQHVPADHLAILRVEHGSAGVELGDAKAIGRGGGGPVRVSATITRRVAVDGVALFSNEVGDELLWASAASVRAGRITSVMCVPLLLGERAIAVLYLDSSDRSVRFSDHHLELVTAIADLAALPLDLAWRGVLPSLPIAVGRAETGVEDTAPSVLPAVDNAGRAAVILRPDQPLHLGNAVLLASPLERLAKDRFPRLILVLDYAAFGESEGASGLLGAVLDRLALFAPATLSNVALATQVPSVARLATMVASLVRPSKELQDDYLRWFREVLLAAGLVATGATHAVIEPDPPRPATDSDSPVDVFALDAAVSDLAVTRRLVAQLNELSPGICPFPVPLLSGFQPFLSLDGRGPMGVTAKGAIFVSDSADVVAKKIRAARTDAHSAFDPTAEVSAELRNLLMLLFALTGEPTSSMLDRFAGKGYAAMKLDLVDAANAFLDPIRVRRAALASDTDLARAVVRTSAKLDQDGRRLAETLSRSPGALRG